MIGRVIKIFGQRIVITCDNIDYEAVVGGKVKYADSASSLIAVGDYVEFSTKEKDMAQVDRIIPRKSCISRPAIEKEGIVQIIVANIDRIVIVTSIAHPHFKPGLVDRFLIVAVKESIKPVVVINKIDLSDASEISRYIEAWRKISCDVILTSAETGVGIENLSALLQTGTSVIAGHSGVGKSSLLNYINPELKIKIGLISHSSGRGMHTTSRVTLYRLFHDGWVADTPGLKDFGLAGISRKTLNYYYPEFAAFENQCQFGNCIHINEPGCAVKKAIETGELIPKFRYDSYLAIYKTLQ
jgi:ribosome biogenesis GTPase / thiamine phosphate phosphatase